MNATLEYIAAGGNRHPSAADWAPGLLAFGAGNNIALWNPESERQNGISALLSGHTDHVNVVKIYDTPGKRLILSGSADKSIRIWKESSDVDEPFKEATCLTAHEGSINTISALPDLGVFVSGAADGTVKVWSLAEDAGAKLAQSISLKPRYLPLATALFAIESDAIVLAVAGTSSIIQIFVQPASDAEFQLQATLTGHESWIRSLDFEREQIYDGSSDVLLASASQDKFIRVWRFREGGQIVPATTDAALDPAYTPSLSNKSHGVHTKTSKYNVTFEALLIGHEDWVYAVRWAPRTQSYARSTLLSASADNSLAIWTPDEHTGIWVCNTRLGEISAQKGSTSATGSTGGFWTGLWQPDGQSVVSLGRTGSWRRWTLEDWGLWMQAIGISGHTQEVQSLAWSPDGSYLLTTSSDQTTRLFAEWKREGQHSWHEMARPQIHGYDLNCIGSITNNQFISGADEKLLRVFDKPKAIDTLLSRLSGTSSTADSESLPDAANIPVLGLSNKAIAAVDDDDTEATAQTTTDNDANNREAVDPADIVHKSTLDISHPPFEDHLARHTLWPEREKLYGHGYEISAVTAMPMVGEGAKGLLISTACKASSLDHAVVRQYGTRDWRELKPSLSAHSLTVTNLASSPDGTFLLSVGRDRQWAVWGPDPLSEHSESQGHVMLMSNPKAHARMILDCSWAPAKRRGLFATAGRDKVVKIWQMEGAARYECVATITGRAPVTSVAFALEMDDAKGGVTLAYATEEGNIEVIMLDGESLQPKSSMAIPQALCPSRAVNALRWREYTRELHQEKAGASYARQLAAVSDDTSVRIFNIDS